MYVTFEINVECQLHGRFVVIEGSDFSLDYAQIFSLSSHRDVSKT